MSDMDDYREFIYHNNPFLALIKKDQTMTNCIHKLVEYIGFTDSFNYCSLCNKKESEFTVEKSLVPKYAEEEISSAWENISTSLKTDMEMDTKLQNITGLSAIIGLNAWLPEQTAYLNAFRDAGIYGHGTIDLATVTFKPEHVEDAITRLKQHTIDNFFGVNRSNYLSWNSNYLQKRLDAVSELIENDQLSAEDGRKLLGFEDLESESISGTISHIDKATGKVTISVDNTEVLLGLEIGTKVSFNE
jgi:hypothetical protein